MSHSVAPDIHTISQRRWQWPLSCLPPVLWSCAEDARWQRCKRTCIPYSGSYPPRLRVWRNCIKGLFFTAFIKGLRGDGLREVQATWSSGRNATRRRMEPSNCVCVHLGVGWNMVTFWQLSGRTQHFINSTERKLHDSATRDSHIEANPLKPNDIYICRTAQLTSRRCILYIYSTNIRTEYFKHAA